MTNSELIPIAHSRSEDGTSCVDYALPKKLTNEENFNIRSRVQFETYLKSKGENRKIDDLTQYEIVHYKLARLWEHLEEGDINY